MCNLLCFQRRHLFVPVNVESKKLHDLPEQPINTYMPPIYAVKYTTYYPSLQTIADDVVMLVAVNMLPLSLVDSSRFHKLK